MTHADVLTPFDWTRDDFELARRCGFPAGTQSVGGTFMNPTMTLKYRVDDVDAWIERIQTIAQTLK
jgi:hypothetical protein